MFFFHPLDLSTFTHVSLFSVKVMTDYGGKKKKKSQFEALAFNFS